MHACFFCLAIYVSMCGFTLFAECYVNGEEVGLNCQTTTLSSGFFAIEWQSVPPTQAGFSCLSNNTAENNTITLLSSCRQPPETGTCGSYTGVLNCDTYMSKLTFISSYYSSMNGGLILCQLYHGQERSNQSFPLKIGSKYSI